MLRVARHGSLSYSNLEMAELCNRAGIIMTARILPPAALGGRNQRECGEGPHTYGRGTRSGQEEVPQAEHAQKAQLDVYVRGSGRACALALKCLKRKFRTSKKTM